MNEILWLLMISLICASAVLSFLIIANLIDEIRDIFKLDKEMKNITIGDLRKEKKK